MDDADRHDQLERWFRAYGDRVFAYLLHRTDRASAEDVLQEVFVTAFRKADKIPDPPIGWLLGTARRTLANHARGQRRRERLALRLAEHQRPAGADDHPGAVTDALAQLSTTDREVLTLHAWYGLTADEAAQALGCSPGAYAVRLHRARRRLADRLRATAARTADLAAAPGDQP